MFAKHAHQSMACFMMSSQAAVLLFDLTAVAFFAPAHFIAGLFEFRQADFVQVPTGGQQSRLIDQVG